MAKSTVQSANVVQQWDSDFFAEYVRDSKFSSLMGTDENAIIQVKEDLTKKAGDTITIPLVEALTGDGVSGTSTLEGNEEALVNYGHAISVDMLRNAVRIHKFEEQKSSIDLRNAGRTMLKLWAMSKLRDMFIARLYSPHVDGTTAYASASEANKDAWLSANSDRVQCGAVISNTSSLDHSTSLANIDNTNDKLTTSLVSLIKRRAKTASNRAIRPYRMKNGDEVFVLLAGSLPFRDLKESSAMQQAMRDGMARGLDNGIFNGGDLYWDGVIIKEVPEIGVLSSVGNGSINVAATFLCGAQALGLAWAQRTQSKTQMFDYDAEYGVAIEEIRGCEKLSFNSVQHGVLTCYVAAVADS